MSENSNCPGAKPTRRTCDAPAEAQPVIRPATRAVSEITKRFVSVWLPTFAIDRLRQDAYRKATAASEINNKPFVLAQAGVHGLTITAVNDRARKEGIYPGQPLADARAAISGLATQPAEPRRDLARLRSFAYAAGRYGPARNVEEEDGLWVDITGVAHLFGGEKLLAQDLLDRLAHAGFRAQIGIADTPAAAFALARYSVATPSQQKRIAIAEPAATAKALIDLSVEALRLEIRTVTLLKRLGLRRIGQLYTLPRAVLARRFRDLKHKGAGRAAEREGLAQAVVMRLDQALGRIADPRIPITEPPAYIARRSYPEMLITSDGIETACYDLAGELCVMMAARHKGARRLRFALYRADGGIADAVIGTSRPCRAPQHLIELFRDKLERLDAGLGVDMITLEALQVEAVSPTQARLTKHSEHTSGNLAESRAALIDRLVNRLGSDAVFRLEDVASHIPERAQRRITNFSRLLADPLAHALNRPSFLFAHPEPITVIAEVPDGAPVRFTWRRVTHRIVKAEGPERIAPEWWQWLRQLSHLENGTDLSSPDSTQSLIGPQSQPDLPSRTAAGKPVIKHPLSLRVRDYYRLEDDSGAAYWVFRGGLYQSETEDGAPEWFVHGLYG